MTIQVREDICSCCGSPPVAGTHFAPADEADEVGRARRDARPARAVLRTSRWRLGELRDYADWSDGEREVGGWLFGSIEADGAFALTDMTAPRLEDPRDERSMLIFGADAVEAEREMPAGEGLIGTWHVHPSGGGDLSAPDVAAARRTAELWRLARVVEVVFTPDSWSGWRASAYVVDAAGVARAEIEEV